MLLSSSRNNLAIAMVYHKKDEKHRNPSQRQLTTEGGAPRPTVEQPSGIAVVRVPFLESLVVIDIYLPTENAGML